MKVIADRRTVAKRGIHALMAALSVHVVVIFFGPPIFTGAGNRAEASLIPAKPPTRAVDYRLPEEKVVIRPEVREPDADVLLPMDPVEDPEAPDPPDPPEPPEPPGLDSRTLGGDDAGLGPWQNGPSDPPAVLSHVEPAYPEMARRAEATGTVIVEVTIDRKGRVIAAEISSSDTIGVLEDAALDAARRWTFRPARQGHRPVTCRARLEFVFTL